MDHAYCWLFLCYRITVVHFFPIYTVAWVVHFITFYISVYELMHKLAATKTITLPTSRSTNLYATTSKSFHGTPPYRGLSSVQEIQNSGSSSPQLCQLLRLYGTCFHSNIWRWYCGLSTGPPQFLLVSKLSSLSHYNVCSNSLVGTYRILSSYWWNRFKMVYQPLAKVTSVLKWCINL